ncbi:MAG: hypothetical protein DRI57_33455 [Deltaproteobacteria bacterium]|nr:MAG: hypothetical protein DRI57_33455 [Deltaproteobacteria bacterium]
MQDFRPAGLTGTVLFIGKTGIREIIQSFDQVRTFFHLQDFRPAVFMGSGHWVSGHWVVDIGSDQTIRLKS